MGKMDSEKGTKGLTGEKLPKGAQKADMSGERRGKIVGGVAQGKEDATGADKQYNTGKTEGVCYEHKRTAYHGEDAGMKDKYY